MSLKFKNKNHERALQNNSPGSSSQSFEEDEYLKVIEGIKKTYKQKIRPLEVTYNFEGKNKNKYTVSVPCWLIKKYLKFRVPFSPLDGF
jgi:hypothetical protein